MGGAGPIVWLIAIHARVALAWSRGSLVKRGARGGIAAAEVEYDNLRDSGA